MNPATQRHRLAWLARFLALFAVLGLFVSTWFSVVAIACAVGRYRLARKTEVPHLGRRFVLFVTALLALACAREIGLWYFQREFTHAVIGEPFYLGDRLDSYDGHRDMFGDGYSISVYRLPQGIIERIQDGTLPRGPEAPYSRDGWRLRRWRRAPTEDDDTRAVYFALLSDPSPVSERLIAEAAAFLASSNAYYCYSYYCHDWDGVVNDVDFYILAPESGVLIVINRNS